MRVYVPRYYYILVVQEGKEDTYDFCWPLSRIEGGELPPPPQSNGSSGQSRIRCCVSLCCDAVTFFSTISA